jgi:hypothetical protein
MDCGALCCGSERVGARLEMARAGSLTRNTRARPASLSLSLLFVTCVLIRVIRLNVVARNSNAPWRLFFYIPLFIYLLFACVLLGYSTCGVRGGRRRVVMRCARVITTSLALRVCAVLIWLFQFCTIAVFCRLAIRIGWWLEWSLSCSFSYSLGFGCRFNASGALRNHPSSFFLSFDRSPSLTSTSLRDREYFSPNQSPEYLLIPHCIAISGQVRVSPLPVCVLPHVMASFGAM